MFLLYSESSWLSALSFCEERGGSLPQLQHRDDIHGLLVSEDFHAARSYAVFIGLRWVSDKAMKSGFNFLIHQNSNNIFIKHQVKPLQLKK